MFPKQCLWRHPCCKNTVYIDILSVGNKLYLSLLMHQNIVMCDLRIEISGFMLTMNRHPNRMSPPDIRTVLRKFYHIQWLLGVPLVI